MKEHPRRLRGRTRKWETSVRNQNFYSSIKTNRTKPNERTNHVIYLRILQKKIQIYVTTRKFEWKKEEEKRRKAKMCRQHFETCTIFSCNLFYACVCCVCGADGDVMHFSWRSMVQSEACATFGRMLRQFNENHRITSTIITMAEKINDPPSKRHQKTSTSLCLFANHIRVGGIRE